MLVGVLVLGGGVTLAAVLLHGKYDLELLCGSLGFLLGLTLLNIP